MFKKMSRVLYLKHASVTTTQRYSHVVGCTYIYISVRVHILYTEVVETVIREVGLFPRFENTDRVARTRHCIRDTSVLSVQLCVARA